MSENVEDVIEDEARVVPSAVAARLAPPAVALEPEGFAGLAVAPHDGRPVTRRIRACPVFGTRGGCGGVELRSDCREGGSEVGARAGRVDLVVRAGDDCERRLIPPGIRLSTPSPVH